MHKGRHRFDVPSSERVKAHSKKDTARWCKGIVGREHIKEWLQRAESYLHDWQTLTCINCDKQFDSRWPCRDCGQFKCGGHREPFTRQRRKYPHESMGAPANECYGPRFREGTSYRRRRDG